MSREAPFVDYMVTVISEDRTYKEHSSVTAEFPLQIAVNGRHLVNLLCTPDHLEELVAGFLYSEGMISSLEDLLYLKIEHGKAEVQIKGEVGSGEGWVPWVTSGCGQNISWRGEKEENCIFKCRIASEVTVPAAAIIDLMGELQRSSVLYKKTRGVHGAALADKNRLVIFREDIGRHNAVDKVAGGVLHQRLNTSDKLLLTTGRISSEIVTKTARLGIPFLISRSVPTDYAIQLGELVGITIVGFARGRRFKVYSHDWRVN